MIPLHATIDELTVGDTYIQPTNYEDDFVYSTSNAVEGVGNKYTVRIASGDISWDTVIQNMDDFYFNIDSNVLDISKFDITTYDNTAFPYPFLYIIVYYDGVQKFITLKDLDPYYEQDLSSFNLSFFNNGFDINFGYIKSALETITGTPYDYTKLSVKIELNISFEENIYLEDINYTGYSFIYYDKTITATPQISGTTATILQIIPFIIIAGIVVSAVLLIKKED